MVGYLLKLFYLVIFSLVVISVYYGVYTYHQESFSPYIHYIITIFSFYLAYKALNYIKNEKVLVFSPLKIFFYFLLHLFILSILFFSLNGLQAGFGISLFLKIVIYMIIPITIIIISISFGKFLLEKIPGFKNESVIFQFLISLGVGFFIFLTLLTLFGFFGFYNIFTVLIILSLMLGISIKNFINIIKGLYEYEIKIEDHDYDGKDIFQTINLKLLTTELLFIIITFLISVNLINAVRPMPIGWDDLGVYMNNPNLLAQAGSILNLGGMLTWNIFTGIGYMFNSATQAFFLNNVGGVLGVLVIILSLYDLLKSKTKTFINIPLLCGAIFISMPMIVFQQAKDQKLDPGLFFISAIAIYLVLYIFLKYLGYKEEQNLNNNLIIKEEKTKDGETIEITFEQKTKNEFLSYFSSYTHLGNKDLFDNKSYLIYIFIIGILAGFAFSIKVTSLLLISSIIGIFFYSKLGIAGLMAYFSFYTGIFTKFGFWSMMNVVYPKDDINLVNNVFIYSILVGALLLGYSLIKYKLKALNGLFKILGIFILGTFLALSPWIVKNTISLNGNISIRGIIYGKRETFNVDYTKIHSEEKLNEIKKNIENSLISSSGTSFNEDMGRYFGYEKGINNYIKLPYNLTMQTNQRGEYTDITYIFLALMPTIILFLAYKKSYLIIGSLFFSLGSFLFFFGNHINNFLKINIIPDINGKLTEIFSKLELPFGYLIIILFFIIPFLYLIYTLNKEKLSIIFKLNLVFAVFYIFLWTISALGIVWYGIAMYYSLILAIGIGFYYISNYQDLDELKEKIIKFFGSFVALFIVGIYFFNSSFPHGFTNLKQSSYASFKAGISNNYQSIFETHIHYFDLLEELNIKANKKEILIKSLIDSIKNQELKNILINNNIKTLKQLNIVLIKILNLKDEKNKLNLKDEKNNLKLVNIKKEAKILQKELYKNILYPKDEFKNNAGIYRIGTFLRYFISDNYKRLLEDGLIFEFDRYFYDENDINLGIERMKKIGVDYFLVDLNAATIDRDPRHDLTRRFENLLKTFTSEKLELISTDSLCLQTALEIYNKSEKTPKDLKDYMYLAGVNYESYTESGEVINRGIKQIACYNKILEIIGKGEINDNNFKYLTPIANFISQNKINSEEELLNFFRNYVGHGWFVLFKIK